MVNMPPQKAAIIEQVFFYSGGVDSGKQSFSSCAVTLRRRERRAVTLRRRERRAVTLRRQEGRVGDGGYLLSLRAERGVLSLRAADPIFLTESKGNFESMSLYRHKTLF